MLLKRVRAIKIKDSRGDPTIEISVNGTRASAPTGKSKGVHETPTYKNSLDWNINFLNKIDFNLKIKSFQDLKKVEAAIRKRAKIRDVKKFGANALFALEAAILKALARDQKKQLWQIINLKAKKIPRPLGNVIEGGLHAHNKEHPTFQEFLVIPNKKSFKQNYVLMKKIHKTLKLALNAKTKTDEGAWQTSMNNEQIFMVLSKFKDISIGVDIAASSFYKKGNYEYKDKILDKETQVNYINSIIKKYKPLYIEDPLEEEDFKGYSKIKKSKKSLVVGDDLTATQISRVKKAIRLKSMNAMIIKPNQNGSLLELEQIFRLCKKHGIKTALSHRSGETMDNALADLAFGFGADFIKAGVATKWRQAKLDRLENIEKYLR